MLPQMLPQMLPFFLGNQPCPPSPSRGSAKLGLQIDTWKTNFGGHPWTDRNTVRRKHQIFLNVQICREHSRTIYIIIYMYIHIYIHKLCSVCSVSHYTYYFQNSKKQINTQQVQSWKIPSMSLSQNRHWFLFQVLLFRSMQKTNTSYDNPSASRVPTNAVFFSKLNPQRSTEHLAVFWQFQSTRALPRIRRLCRIELIKRIKVLGCFRGVKTLVSYGSLWCPCGEHPNSIK
jgi:hypothetical protein